MSVCVRRFALQKTPAKGNPVQAQDFFAERFVFLAFGRWPVKQDHDCREVARRELAEEKT